MGMKKLMPIVFVFLALRLFVQYFVYFLSIEVSHLVFPLRDYLLITEAGLFFYLFYFLTCQLKLKMSMVPFLVISTIAIYLLVQLKFFPCFLRNCGVKTVVDIGQTDTQRLFSLLPILLFILSEIFISFSLIKSGFKGKLMLPTKVLAILILIENVAFILWSFVFNDEFQERYPFKISCILTDLGMIFLFLKSLKKNPDERLEVNWVLWWLLVLLQ